MIPRHFTDSVSSRQFRDFSAIAETHRPYIIPLLQVILALGDYMSVQCHCCIGGTSIGEDIRKLDYGQHVVSGTPGRVFGMSAGGLCVYFFICGCETVLAYSAVVLPSCRPSTTVSHLYCTDWLKLGML